MIKSINVIAAMDNNYGVGKDGKIPWHYSEDFEHFKKITQGHVLIMGRATFDDILTYSKNNKVMPDRKLIVITSRPLPILDNVRKAESYEEALKIASEYEADVFFIGGERIFEYGINIADTVFLTHINKNFNCDKFFPYDKLRTTFSLLHTKKSKKHSSEVTYKTYIRI